MCAAHGGHEIALTRDAIGSAGSLACCTKVLQYVFDTVAAAQAGSNPGLKRRIVSIGDHQDAQCPDHDRCGVHRLAADSSSGMIDKRLATNKGRSLTLN